MKVVRQEVNSGIIAGTKFTVVENDNEIGRAYLYVFRNDLHEQPFGLLEDVFVTQDARGKGVGTQLVQSVIDAAKRTGCYKLIATSRFEREYVHAMYERMGFARWGYEFRLDFSAT